MKCDEFLGWIEDYYSESTESIVNSYIQRGDHNIGEFIGPLRSTYSCIYPMHYHIF